MKKFYFWMGALTLIALTAGVSTLVVKKTTKGNKNEACLNVKAGISPNATEQEQLDLCIITKFDPNNLKKWIAARPADTNNCAVFKQLFVDEDVTALKQVHGNLLVYKSVQDILRTGRIITAHAVVEPIQSASGELRWIDHESWFYVQTKTGTCTQAVHARNVYPGSWNDPFTVCSDLDEAQFTETGYLESRFEECTFRPPHPGSRSMRFHCDNKKEPLRNPPGHFCNEVPEGDSRFPPPSRWMKE